MYGMKFYCFNKYTKLQKGLGYYGKRYTATLSNNKPGETAISRNQSSISDFYDGTSVFLTGVTGFLGKSILEKILRTCTGVQRVYVLIRPKKELNGGDRLKRIFATAVFDKVKESNPEAINKVKVIDGDVTYDNLNISRSDRLVLLNNVNIVLHTAATVSFSQPLKETIELNTVGTKNVLDLCKGMRNLKSFVHVSTLTCVMKTANRISEEKVYKTAYNPKEFCNLIQQLPPDVVRTVESKLINDEPNNYAFSKHLTEALVQEYNLPNPTAIVRLPAVGASWIEPFPGWSERVQALSGYVSQIGRGTLRSAICKNSTVINLVPVDIAANTVIAAAWHSAIHRSNTTEVYNCTNGNINPLTFKQYFEYAEQYGKQFPSLKVLWYPGMKLTENIYLYWIKQKALQFLLALALEIRNIFSSNCYWKKRAIMRNYGTSIHMLNVSQFYLLHEYNIEMNNMLRLVKDVKATSDRDKFNLDISKGNGLHWDEYMKEYVLGMRKHVFKEDLSSLPEAKLRLKRLHRLHNILAVGTVGSALAITYLQFL